MRITRANLRRLILEQISSTSIDPIKFDKVSNIVLNTFKKFDMADRFAMSHGDDIGDKRAKGIPFVLGLKRYHPGGGEMRTPFPIPDAKTAQQYIDILNKNQMSDGEKLNFELSPQKAYIILRGMSSEQIEDNI